MSAYDPKQTSSKCGGFDLGAQRRLQLAMRGRCARRTRTWGRIAALYEALAALTHSPVIELNRAVAVGMAFGPEAGLELADQLTAEPLLEAYHLLPSVRGDLLEKLGRFDEARSEFERAAALALNAHERKLLLDRAVGARKHMWGHEDRHAQDSGRSS